MTCEACQAELLQSSESHPVRSQACEEHRQHCAACRDVAEALERVDQALSEWAKASPTPAGFKSALLARIPVAAVLSPEDLASRRAALQRDYEAALTHLNRQYGFAGAALNRVEFSSLRHAPAALIRTAIASLRMLGRRLGLARIPQLLAIVTGVIVTGLALTQFALPWEVSLGLLCATTALILGFSQALRVTRLRHRFGS